MYTYFNWSVLFQELFVYLASHKGEKIPYATHNVQG